MCTSLRPRDAWPCAFRSQHHLDRLAARHFPEGCPSPLNCLIVNDLEWDAEMTDGGGRTTRVLVDGENIDATVGQSILGRRPNPDERPRWDRLIAFSAQVWQQPAKGVLFLNASAGIPMPFAQALKAMGFVVVPLSGTFDEKVVDIAIQRTLRRLTTYPGDVMLVSHDGDFIDDLQSLTDGNRRLAVIGFPEFRNARFTTLEASRNSTSSSTPTRSTPPSPVCG